MAVTFLQIDGIEGELQTKGHEGVMLVLDWGWWLGQPGTLHTAPIGRGTASKQTVDNRTIVSALHTASPTLILACAHSPAQERRGAT